MLGLGLFKKKVKKDRHFLVSVKLYKGMTFIEETVLHLVGHNGQMINRAEATIRVKKAHTKDITRCVFGVPVEYTKEDCNGFTVIPQYIQEAIENANAQQAKPKPNNVKSSTTRRN